MSRMSRRRFAFGGLCGGLSAIGVAAASGYHARASAPYEPVLERVSLALPPAHANLAGLRIGFVADTHIGPAISPDDVVRALDLLTPEQPDLILLGGDYISGSPRYAPVAAEVLGAFARTAPLGAIAILGNHDCGEIGRAERVTEALQAEGIQVLRNEPALVTTEKGPLWIAGIDDEVMGRANPNAAFDSVPSGAAVLALWHEPDYAAITADLGAFAQLSGHSHGGQVRLPGIGPVFLPPGGSRYVMGMNHARGMPVYTSRGIGVFFPPIRFNCPPEVTLVTLAAESV